VRSFRGTFAFVTSPLLLTLAARDLEEPPPIPRPPPNHCMAGPQLAEGNTVYLEDLDLTAVPVDAPFAHWQKTLAPIFGPDVDEQQVFSSRFAVVDDETMTFLWETATQLDQRVRISPDTRTVAKGALWLEESLPPETLLIGLLVAEQSRKQDYRRLGPEEVLQVVLPASEQVLQFGGKSTVGRGRCRMVPL
jgi:CRISPR-associated protein Cmr4